MKFEIKPTSGFDNSYYDIEFSIDFTDILPSDFKLMLRNKTVDKQINILATSSGFINSEGIVFSPPCSRITGYFNPFNDDKMNKGLENYREIEIECTVEGDNIKTASLFFYNESYSADNEIFPFSAKIINPIIDLSTGEPLRLEINSDAEKSVHFLISCKTKKVEYDFYVLTSGSSQKIEIPIEILHYELNLYRTKSEKFQLCYLKKHGVNYHNIVNEKEIPIPGTEMTFTGNFCLLPQTRFDPVNRELDDNYLLSDRYFVPTLKEYSFFSRKIPSFGKSVYDSRFRDEVSLLKFRKIKEPPVVSDTFWKTEENRPVKQTTDSVGNFYSTMNKIMSNDEKLPVSEKIKTTAMMGARSTKQKGGEGCADCARKKREREARSR